MHFVIVPMWKESYEVVEPTIQSLINSKYDTNKLVVVIAYEERGGAVPESIALRLTKKYKDKFSYMRAIKHPAGLPNEVIGKGGNITWAAREMLSYFSKNNISSNRVLVTTLDSDNHPHPNYFAHPRYYSCKWRVVGKSGVCGRELKYMNM